MSFCVIYQGYLHALGMSRTAQVKRDARMGEAEARRDAGIRVSVNKSSLWRMCAMLR